MMTLFKDLINATLLLFVFILAYTLDSILVQQMGSSVVREQPISE